MQKAKDLLPEVIITPAAGTSATMPELNQRRISEPACVSGKLPFPASCLVDTLRTKGATYDRRRRRISLDRLSTKLSKRRKSLPVLPSYLVLSTQKSVSEKEQKGVTFPMGVQIQQVVTEGEVEELKDLLQKHGNKIVEEREPNGLPPIMRAIFEDQMECLKVLLQAGADVTAQDLEEWNALHVASAMDNLEAAKLILQAGRESKGLTQVRNMDSERPIDLTESVELTRILLDADLAEFRLDCHTAEEHVSHTEAGEAEVLELIKQCYKSHNSAAALDEVLRKNTSYSSLLHLAAAKGYSRLADYVFTHWVPALESRNENGWTPLHTAAYFNNVDMALLLVDRGASIHAISQSLEKPSDLTENELILSILDNSPLINSIGSV